MTRVLIVDDHGIVRLGLQTFFREEATDFLIGEAATGQEALDKCRAEAWDVVLLDISLPGLGGQQVLQQLHHERPALPVVMLSFFVAHDHVRQCLDAGAAGYVAKEEIPDHVLPAIQSILAGRRYVSPAAQAVLGENGLRD
jgi:two-component system invasion response regulator UvrY